MSDPGQYGGARNELEKGTDGAGQYDCAARTEAEKDLTITAQDSYRWYKDDGTEATATSEAAQDTPITLAKETPKHFRQGVQYVVTLGGKAVELQYKEKLDHPDEWRKLL
jgi:hypothetical protein